MRYVLKQMLFSWGDDFRIQRWFSWTDIYGVDIAQGEDDIPILASTVVIDLACHKKKDD